MCRHHEPAFGQPFRALDAHSPPECHMSRVAALLALATVAFRILPLLLIILMTCAHASRQISPPYV